MKRPCLTALWETPEGSNPGEILSAIMTHWDPSKKPLDMMDQGYSGKFDDVLRELPEPVRNVILKHHGSGITFLGAGSSRATFDVGSGAVLKVAINAAGQSQNKSEANLGRNPGTKEFVPRTLKWDDQSWRWIIVEKVEPLSSGEFEALTRIQVQTRRGAVVQGPPLGEALAVESPPDFRDHYWESLTPQQRRLANLVWKHDLLPLELDEPSHWGRTKDGRIVLLDPGLNSDTWKANYA